MEPDRYERLVQEALASAESFNRNNPFELSVAMGHVQIFDNRILEAVQEADRRMYANKAALKQSREYTAGNVQP